MKKTTLFLFLIGIITNLSLLSKSAHAAGFQLYEQGTAIIGSAAVGQAVVLDASSSYFNPANMSRLCDPEMQLGGQLISTDVRFSPNASNTFSGTESGNAGNLFPGVAVFLTSPVSESVSVGFSITSPFSGVLQYNDGWVGRYFNQSANLLTLDGNLAMAYKFDECWSLGVGVLIEYAQLYERIGIPVSSTIDGQADLRLDSYRPGATVGLLYTPCGDNSTRIGLSYRSPVDHHPTGNAYFLRLTNTPSVKSILNLPQSVIVSLSQDMSDDFILLAELGWSNWSTFQNTNITIANVTLPVTRNWKDTYRLGLGGKYYYYEDIILQAGVSYDSSPCNASNRLPDLPADHQLRVGAGLQYITSECVTVGFQYEYINFGHAPIHNITRIGTLSGKYTRNFANVFSVSANFKF